jgi:hypothetical protein
MTLNAPSLFNMSAYPDEEATSSNVDESSFGYECMNGLLN